MTTQAMLTEEVVKRWEPIISEESAPKIKSHVLKNQTIRLLENTRKELAEAAANQSGDVAKYDPVLISMIRRTAPSLIANDIIGVQPMSGPTGLIFAMKAWYGTDNSGSGTEAFGTSEPNSSHAAKTTTAAGEILGADQQVTNDGVGTDPVVETNPWPEMSFSIEKASVTAETRALKAKYTHELAQDLKAIHGMDAETELANILSTELVAEINRELVALVNSQSIAITIANDGVTADGVFSLANDTDGRWEIEQLKGLLLFINKQANKIAQQTRRGVGNYIITSANVAGALDLAGKIDTSSVSQDLQWDGVGTTFVGVLNGRYKVYVDPYLTTDKVIIGYKGSNVYDSGIFYAPYIPLQMYKAQGEDDFQPRIGFKTRYGLAVNPFVSSDADPTSSTGANQYYRSFTVAGL